METYVYRPKGVCSREMRFEMDGDVIESRFAVERRNRTIHKRMREYLYTLKHHPNLLTSIIPLGDGITVSVKQEMPQKKVRQEQEV